VARLVGVTCAAFIEAEDVVCECLLRHGASMHVPYSVYSEEVVALMSDGAYGTMLCIDEDAAGDLL